MEIIGFAGGLNAGYEKKNRDQECYQGFWPEPQDADSFNLH